MATPAAGILLVNLGTPDSPEPRDVKRYLREFLWDPRVVEGSRVVWWLVLNGIILNTRPKKSAAAYRKIWSEEGSPLLAITRRQATALQEAVGDKLNLEIAMRYGNPSIAQGLKRLQQSGCNRILVFPLYPQYSATTTGSIFDAVTSELQQWRYVPELRLVNQYYDNPAYIEALATSVRNHWAQGGRGDKLVMSFHGLPQEYADAGDPYPRQCARTAELLADKLELDKHQWLLTYQSRLGKKAWLQPYTDKTLEQLAAEGTEHVQVICPGFAADCLETLEEIAIENREVFLAAGGKKYEYIPCLNDNPEHVEMLTGLVSRYTHGWTDQE